MSPDDYGDSVTKWKYSGKDVSFEQIDEALKALDNACLHCGADKHSPDCPIGKAKIELYNIRCTDRHHVPNVRL